MLRAVLLDLACLRVVLTVVWTIYGLIVADFVV